MTSPVINQQSFSDLGGTLLSVHYDYKYLVEYFKPYIMDDIIFYKNRYICILNPYLATTFLHKIIRNMQYEIDTRNFRAGKLELEHVNHSYNYMCYNELPDSVTLVVHTHTGPLRYLSNYLYLELYLRTLNEHGDIYNDITITNTMSTK